MVVRRAWNMNTLDLRKRLRGLYVYIIIVITIVTIITISTRHPENHISRLELEKSKKVEKGGLWEPDITCM